MARNGDPIADVVSHGKKRTLFESLQQWKRKQRMGISMKHMYFAGCLAVGLMVGAGSCAFAAVAPEEAKQLGGPVLTPFGSEKAGNREGTIPAYTGVGPKAPPDWDPKNPRQRPDPYREKPLFSITAENAAQYADKLDGTIEVFKRYPNFRMDVYPSHRDYRMPQYVIENTIKNATSCKAVDNELKLDGCYGGSPFPIPKTGNQAMWNHLLGYNAWNQKGRGENWIVPPTGAPSLVSRGEYLNNWPYYDPDTQGILPSDAIFFRYLGKDEEPARLAGGQTMFFDPVDQIGVGRRAYVYATGRRWVKIAADLAHDTPSPYAGGSATMDDSRVFMGAMDRYNFELVGKKEKFIYYNTYMFADQKACSMDRFLSTKGFPNPDCVRWELHRVWVVRATLKPGARHIYHKRIFYWDEDSFLAGQGENYDASGKLIRMSNSSFLPFFEAPASFAGGTVYMDFETGIWSATAMANCTGCGWEVMQTRLPANTFDPDAMAGAGIR